MDHVCSLLISRNDSYYLNTEKQSRIKINIWYTKIVPCIIDLKNFLLPIVRQSCYSMYTLVYSHKKYHDHREF